MRHRAIKKMRHAGQPGPLPDYGNGTKAVFDYEVRMLPTEGDPDEVALIPSDQFEVIDDTRKKWPEGYGQPLEIVFGKQFSLPVFEECISTMQPQEVASFDMQPLDLLPYPMMSKKLRDLAKDQMHKAKGEDVRPSTAHSCCWSQMAHAQGLGYKHLDELVAQPRPLRFTIHLHKVLQLDDYEQQSWQLNEQQKLDSVEELRQKGNAAFSRKDWLLAAEKYMEAIMRLDSLMLNEKPGEPEHVDLDQRKIPFHLNLCQCELNLGQYYSAINQATEALTRDPDSEKGLYRRAMAYMYIWDLDAAEKDLAHLAEAHPSSSGTLAQQQLARCKQMRAQKDKEDKQRFKNVLS